MDEIERLSAIQGIEADLLHRRERREAERHQARLAAYARRARRAAEAEAASAARTRGGAVRQWWVSRSTAWRMAR
jgi:hypothetical protein